MNKVEHRFLNPPELLFSIKQSKTSKYTLNVKEQVNRSVLVDDLKLKFDIY